MEICLYRLLIYIYDDTFDQGRIQDLQRGREANHGEHGARAYNGGLGMGAHSGVQGQSPAGDQRDEAPLKLKAFCPFSQKRGQKIRI